MGGFLASGDESGDLGFGSLFGLCLKSREAGGDLQLSGFSFLGELLPECPLLSFSAQPLFKSLTVSGFGFRQRFRLFSRRLTFGKPLVELCDLFLEGSGGIDRLWGGTNGPGLKPGSFP